MRIGHGHVRRVIAATLLGLWTLSTQGCMVNENLLTTRAATGSAGRAADRITRDDKGTYTITADELDQICRAFADRYMTQLYGATNALSMGNDSPEQRRMAHMFRLAAVTSAYDIVTNPDPFTQLLDLLLVITLQCQVWIDDARADDVFGPRGQLLVDTLREGRVEIWDIAAKVMTTEQLAVMDRLIWDWRRQHPNVDIVSFVRFNDVAASRGKSIISGVRKGTGFLAPIDEAVQTADEIRRLGERAFFMTKRMPFLLNWQVEAIANEMMVKPEVKQALTAYNSLADSANRATTALERLPGDVAAERTAIVNALDAHTAALQPLVEELHRTIDAGTELATTGRDVAQITQQIVIDLRETGKVLSQTAASFDSVINGPSSGSGGASSFNIESYRQIADQLASTVRELNTLVESTNTLVSSTAWSTHLGELNAATSERVEQATTSSERLVRTIFNNALLLVAATIGLLMCYRAFSVWVKSRGIRASAHALARAPADRNKDA